MPRDSVWVQRNDSLCLWCDIGQMKKQRQKTKFGNFWWRGREFYGSCFPDMPRFTSCMCPLYEESPAMAACAPPSPAISIVPEPSHLYQLIWTHLYPQHWTRRPLRHCLGEISPFDEMTYLSLLLGPFCLILTETTRWALILPHPPHAIGTDGVWDSSQSIFSLDNKQEFLIRLSSLGCVAVGVINNRVWSAFRIVKIILSCLVHSAFFYSAIFHAHVAPRMSTKAIVRPLRKQGFQDLPAVILIESHCPTPTKNKAQGRMVGP